MGLTRFREPIRVKRSGSVKGVEEVGQEGQVLYSPEFKEEALRLSFTPPTRGVRWREIARDLDVSAETLRKKKWVNPRPR
jgi:transposase-like protein